MDEVITTQAERETINRVSLTGSVVHKYRPNNDMIIVTVAVEGKGVNEVDYPNVAFYGADVAERIDKSIPVANGNYVRVNIEASVQTSRKTTESGTRYYQNVVGRTITKAQTNMEALSGKRGLGTHKATSRNDVCIMGSVVSTYAVPSKNGSTAPMCVILTIRAMANGRICFPRVTCFDSALKTKAMTVKNGDFICAVGFLETTTRTPEDGSARQHLESIICKELDFVAEDQE